MKIFTKLSLTAMILAFACAMIGFATPGEKADDVDTSNAIVILKFKTQPDKTEEAVAGLEDLLENVKNEPHFISIKMHVDADDETNILLYEEWDDLAYYKSEHMETDHILKFMSNSSSFLAGPPEITFWNVKRVFE